MHKDDDNPEHFFSIGVSELDGRFLELYINKDTSQVRAPLLYCYFYLLIALGIAEEQTLDSRS